MLCDKYLSKSLQLSVSHKSVQVCVIKQSHTILILSIFTATRVVCDGFNANTCELLTPAGMPYLKIIVLYIRFRNQEFKYTGYLSHLRKLGQPS